MWKRKVWAKAPQEPKAFQEGEMVLGEAESGGEVAKSGGDYYRWGFPI